MYSSVKIRRRAAERLAAGHVWVYSSDVIAEDAIAPGSTVAVMDERGRRLGQAHYSNTSQIALRMLSTRGGEIDRAFFLERIRAAVAFRNRVVSGTEAYRLVYAEADGLPGLIIDRYGRYLALQTLNQGMDAAKGWIVSCLQELLSPAAIVERNDSAVRDLEALPRFAGVIDGDVPDRVRVEMNGLSFAADLLGGQKTGIYLDQRENYRAAARWAHGRALDCFTSCGGFALHMASRCEAVEGVDSGAAVLAAAESNRANNDITNVRFREADVFDLLSGYRSGGQRFDTIVLDPPAFAKSRSAVGGAMRGYKEINLRALQLLAPGGTLVTCSCSHHVSEAMLLETVAEASLEARRPLRILERRFQAADHPVLLTVPETLYLKCLIFEALPA